MLPFIAVIVLVMLSMASLAVDIGFASVQQLRLEALAEASAATSARIDATVRYAHLEPNPVSALSFDCGVEGRDRCIDDLVYPRADEMEDEIAPSPESVGPIGADITFGPGRLVQNINSDCGDGCWEVAAEQAVPLAFGQASMLSFEESSLANLVDARDSGSNLVGDGSPRAGSLRSFGIPITSRVRAEGRPVVRIGRAEPNVMPGRAPIAIFLSAWEGEFESTTPPTPVVVDIEDDDLSVGSPPRDVGQRIGGERNGMRAGVDLLDETSDPLEESTNPYYAYVPLLDDEEEETQLVVGFGFAQIEFESEERIHVTRYDRFMAPVNASASARHLAGADNIARVVAHHDPDHLYADVFLRAPVVLKVDVSE